MKNKTFERLYRRLETKDEENDILKIVTARERKTKDLRNVRCIKHEHRNVLVEEAKTKEQWQSYFYKLFHSEDNQMFRHSEPGQSEWHQKFMACQRITNDEMVQALRKMKTGKAIGLERISTEIWECLAEGLN